MNTYIFCPICDKMEKVEIIEQQAKTIVNSMLVEYTEICFKCPSTNEIFYNTDFMNRNIARAKAAYDKYIILAS